jgi:hypothetical protein
MKNLLLLVSLAEAGTGILLIFFPSLTVSIILGSPLDKPVPLTVARIAGVALISIGTACWYARKDVEGIAATGLVRAVIFYNAGIVCVLVYSGTVLGMSAIGLWAVALIHAAIAGWATSCLLKKAI